jgi:hypothetical protein
VTGEPWNFTEPQRRQFREAHAKAKRQEIAATARPVIDYDALNALVPGLEVAHYDDGRQVLSYAIDVGATLEIEERDGMAVVFTQWRNGVDDESADEDVRGRFPLGALEDIAGCVRQAEQEYRS